MENIAKAYGLTPRETDILHYLADGWRSAAISEKLTLSQATIKKPHGQDVQKLDAHTQQDVMLMVDRETRRLSK